MPDKIEKLEILKYPDERLNIQAEEVDEYLIKSSNINGSKLDNIMKQMMLTLTLNNGIGLAAPQVGIDLKIIIVPINYTYIFLFNPKIIARRNRILSRNEGCLSIPNIKCDLKRSKYVVVKAINKNGKKITLKESGELSIILQHEIDHINGITMIDRLKPKNYKQEIIGRYCKVNKTC